jgi:L-2-aminoadipate reductase
LNDQKFLMNWFVDNKTWVEADKKNSKGEPWRKYYKGPQDRLYRTGDLGRYLESGDVECTGRADDQVKIRGFRIELNDIDSNLRQNPLIRDCKTLVRRDRNEEPTLVSYIVPELKEWPEWLKARRWRTLKMKELTLVPQRSIPRGSGGCRWRYGTT